MCLEDGASVVGEPANHRGVEGDPVCDAICIDEIEQRCEFRDGCAVATECGCEGIQIVNPQCRLDCGDRILPEPLLGQLRCHHIVGQFVHLVDDYAGGGEGVT